MLYFQIHFTAMVLLTCHSQCGSARYLHPECCKCGGSCGLHSCLPDNAIDKINKSFTSGADIDITPMSRWGSRWRAGHIMCTKLRAPMTQSPMSGCMLLPAQSRRVPETDRARMSMTGQSTRQVHLPCNLCILQGQHGKFRLQHDLLLLLSLLKLQCIGGVA